MGTGSGHQVKHEGLVPNYFFPVVHRTGSNRLGKPSTIFFFNKAKGYEFHVPVVTQKILSLRKGFTALSELQKSTFAKDLLRGVCTQPHC